MNTQAQVQYPGAQAALVYLSKPFACARELKLVRWDFALRLSHLQRLGVSESTLRWLVLNGYVDHADEKTSFPHPAQRFQDRGNVAFTDATRFVLSEKGAFVAGVTEDSRPAGSVNSAAIHSVYSHLPRWDACRRVLSFDGCVVKRFRLPAGNQEAVLSAYEEEGWPPSIDDPLPHVPGQRPKERLHVTIRHLNARQENRVLRFRGNGTGEGVLWEPFTASAVNLPTAPFGLRRAA